MIFLAACHKEEIPIIPFDRGDIQRAEVDMGDGYSNQVFFDLHSASIQGQIDAEDWDLAFGHAADHIFLNDGRLMSAWKSPHSDLASATDTSGFQANKRVEVAAKILVEPAVSDLEGIYLIDLGFSRIGLPLGLIWLEIIEVGESNYRIAYRRYGTSEVTIESIDRSLTDGYAHFSFEDGGILPTPDADAWDIRFARYTHQFDDPPIAYLVTGITLNTNGVVAAEVFEEGFENISLSDTLDVEWSDRPDFIGYDWKTYSFETGTYVVDTQRTWLIRTSKGFYFKFRFTDFYDENGNVGVPNFEFRLL